MRDRQQFEQLRVVVEHLLEMRHQPALVDRIAREAAAEMIVDAALADVVERDLDGGEVARFAGAQARAPEKLEQRGLRKFRRAARAAIDRIDDAAELARGVVELGRADRDGALPARARRKLLPSARRGSARSFPAPRGTAARLRAARRRTPAGRSATVFGK